MKITIIDHVVCKADDPNMLGTFLKVERERWQKGPSGFGHEKLTYGYSLVNKKSGQFLTGFLPRVIKECNRRNIHLEIEGNLEKLPYKLPLAYPSIKLFADQEALVTTALREQRGVIQSPTGTGKTVICYAIIAPLMPCKALVICPSKSIMTQTAQEFQEKFGMKASMVGDGVKDLSGDVVVGLINSLARLNPDQIATLFDVVIVDESHHTASFSGQYFQFLTNCLAPMRIGLTATVDKIGSERGMAAEGLLGPVIGQFTFRDAVAANRIVKPKVVLLAVPINMNIRQYTRWNEIYDIGVVFNRIRNTIIAEYVAEQAKEGNTCMVFVKLLSHADLLVDIIEKEGVPCEYVAGSVGNSERERIKIALETKKIMCVVATQAFREGVNVPSLNIVINAAGYKEEKAALQMAGRVLRISEGKTDGIYVDFLDDGKYLSSHCVQRLQALAKIGWL